MSRSQIARSARLVPAAGVAWAIAAVVVLAPAAAPALALGLWGCALAAIVGMRRRPSRGWAVVALAAAAAAVAASHVAVAEPHRHEAASFAGVDGRALVIDALITGGVSASPNGDVWFDAMTERIGAGERALVTEVPIRVGVSADATASLRHADLGARVEVRASALPADAGDRAVLVVRARRAVTVVAPPPGVFGALASMRESLAASASGLARPGAALIPGLATGDTSAVDAGLDEAMKVSSLSHLTAVSGANCAIVVGLAFGLASFCGARRGVRVAAGVGALVLFVLLVTPEPSVVRAAAMASLAMLALALGRTGAGLAVLSLAVVVLLAVDPWLALSLGFALSALATAALLVLARPLAAALGRHMPTPLALGIAVPLAAQLACAPLLVLIDPHVPVLAVAANMLAAPAAPLATITGFLACLATPLPWLQDGLTALAWLPASWIAGVAQTVSAVPAQRLGWLEGWPGVIVLAMVCAVMIVATVLPRPRRRIGRVARTGARLLTAAVIGVAAAQTALQGVAAAWTVPAEAWRIAVCDVGQGDAVLVRSAGATALFDTGPDPAPLRTCLDRFGIAMIDLLVLTHFDQDHVGGVDAVAGRVGTVAHGPAGDDHAAAVLDRLATGGAALEQVGTGAGGTFGAARWRVLWPATSVHLAGNDASVTVEVSGDGLPRTVLLGDLSAEPQARLRAAVTDVDVVKVAHHGSADQDPALYDALDAEVALIPVGVDNDYGHPRASLLGMLTAQGTVVARTDQDGTIAVWMDDGVLRLWREREVGGPR